MTRLRTLQKSAIAGVLFVSGCALVHRPAPVPCAPAASEPFAPGTVSGDEKDAFGAFHPDGSEFYFTRFSIGRDRSSILVSRKVGESWGPPEVLPFSGTFGDREPFMAPDGRSLFFVSDRPHPEKRDPSYDIWTVERLGPGAWSTPIRLPEPINSATSEASPVVARRGTLYFASGRPGGHGAMDLYRAPRTRTKYDQPENLGALVSSADSENGIYVTPDERLMLIARSARGAWGRSGSPDLYVSVRNRGEWSEPRRLGSPANSEAHEFGPTLSPDGKSLHFTRDVTQNFIRDLDASMDIHRVDTCVLNYDRLVQRALDRMRHSSKAR